MATQPEASDALQPHGPTTGQPAAQANQSGQQQQVQQQQQQQAAPLPVQQETVESLVKEIEHLKLKLDEERRKLNDVARE